MNEWQPAVIVNPHNCAISKKEGWQGTKVRVKKIGKHPNGWYTTHPCAQESNWLEVHYEDSRKIGDGAQMVLCEHEVLTD
jgi:hypothetical protein